MNPIKPSRIESAASSAPKGVSDHEGKITLPDDHSNPRQGELGEGPVMYAAPNPPGLGLRSRGMSAPVEARGVTNGEAALQPQSIGAALAAAGHSTKAAPSSSLREPAEHFVIEVKSENDATPDMRRSENEGEVTLRGPGSTTAMGEESSDFQLLSRDEGFEIVKAARALMASEKDARRIRKDTPASVKTLCDYAKKCTRVDTEIALLQEPWGHPIEVVMSRHAPSKQTFYAIRSALRRRALSNVMNILKTQDALQRIGNSSTQWQRTVLQLQVAVKEAELVNSLDRQVLLDLTDRKAVHAFSKKQQLHRLREGWQDDFLSLNAMSPTYKAAGVLLRFCGLRPVELEKGVIVTAEDGAISVEIQGGKVRENHAGQPWRRFALNRDALPAWFVEQLEHEGSVAVSADPDGLRAHLARMSEKLFPRKRKPGKRDIILSAYLFRHALVTELRSDGWDSADIAGVIGESTADTTRWYGLRTRAGSVAPKSVVIVPGSVRTAVPVRPADLSGLPQQPKRRSSPKTRSSPIR